MKMSESFNLPLKVVEPVTQAGGGWPVVSASVEGGLVCGHIGKFEIKKGPHSGTSRYLDVELAEKMANSAAYAINSHDRLEQENAELREALNTLVYKDSWGNYFTGLHGDSDVTEIVKELLNK